MRFVDCWEGTPPLDVPCKVVGREGCDADPVDPTTEAGRLTLVSYVWPDQHERIATLRAALEVAARVPARLERARATEWLARRLAEPATADVATVVFHSIVWQYLPDDERRLVRHTIEEAGARATSSTPLAWLRFEPSADARCAELRLACWPGGGDRLLATAGFHGRPVRWLP